jgi:hypothetical protein
MRVREKEGCPECPISSEQVRSGYEGAIETAPQTIRPVVIRDDISRLILAEPEAENRVALTLDWRKRHQAESRGLEVDPPIDHERLRKKVGCRLREANEADAGTGVDRLLERGVNIGPGLQAEIGNDVEDAGRFHDTMDRDTLNRETTMKESTYRQMTLEKPIGSGLSRRTIWGPTRFAEVGRVVKVEENDGSWSEGWTVKSVHSDPLPEKYVRHMSHAHTRQRKASDI